ncbi:MAG: glycerol-3-phosphate 1-O-acyltransferase PlsY [Acidobacteriota bacterium]
MGKHEIMFLALSYLTGSIPTGFLVCFYLSKNDIRKRGSGNIGATNIKRVCGNRAGIITLIFDILKGLIPALYGIIHFKSPLLIIAGGAAAVTGHIFPPFLKFRGGKGVATFCGLFAAYAIRPEGRFVIPVFLVIFLSILFYSKYVSAASLGGVFSIFFLILFTNTVEVSILVFIMVLIILIKHRDNLGRLLKGEEDKFLWRKNG